MKCRRAFDVDLPAVVRGESTDADFLAHVAGCPDCATEVGVWRELEGMLRAGAPAETVHPEPAALVAFVDAPATLAGGARTAVERHLATCRVCADEVRTLGAVDPARVVVASAAGAPALPEASPRTPTSPARSRSGLARVVWNPAFAYALVAVLLVPVVRAQLPQVESRLPAAARIAAAPAPPSAVRDRADAPFGASGALRDDAALRKAEPAPAAPKAAPPVVAPEAGGLAAAPKDTGLAAAAQAERVAAAKREDRRAAAPDERSASAPAESRQRAALARAPQQAEDARVEPPQVAAVPAPPPPASARPALRAKAAADAGDAAAWAAGGRAESEPARVAQAAPAGAGSVAVEADTRKMFEELKQQREVMAVPRGQVPRMLQVGPKGTPTFTADDGKRRVELRVFPPAPLAAGPVDVTVRGREGQADVQLHVADPPADAIVVPIPPGWLVDGHYSVVLQPVGADGKPASPPTVLGFTVRAPDAQ